MSVLEAGEDLGPLREFLRREPVLNSVPLRILSNAISSDADRAATFIAIVERADDIRAAALRSDFPKMVVAAGGDPGELEELARLVHARMPNLPCVLGRDVEVLAFRAEWERQTGTPGTPGIPQRVHVLDRVEPQPDVPGRMEAAGEKDLELVVDWSRAFAEEAHGSHHEPDEKDRQVAARNIEAGAMFFWIDQGPVSMAAAREFGDGVAQIGPVYTPPDRRRRGYGGALTATATQRMLDQACTACTLFTDLRNATSNHIYREIGYKPVADFHEFWFQPRS
jgi:predicted GNAT family acetyltransferase